MDALQACHRYLNAWKRRDAGAVLDALASDGTYRDPLTPGPIRGDALRAYVQALCAALPDLDFEIGRVARVADNEVHASWTLTGTNTGSLNGLPPTGKAVRVPGIDVIEVGAEGIRSVTGYFDSAALPRQIGLDVIVQPREIGPFSFGTSTFVRPERGARVGALAVTELIADDDATVQRVRELSREVVRESLDDPSFLWFTSASTGRRMMTVSMWDSQQALRAAMQRGTHAQAVREYFGGGVAETGVTSVFTPLRVGPYLQRCAACRTVNRLRERSGTCGCGAALQAHIWGADSAQEQPA